MSLALQARKLGLYAHAMAGFSREKAYEILNAPVEEYDIMAAIAVGYRADPCRMSEPVAAAEKPSDRKPLGDVVRESSF
jgi:nitroreductase